MKERVKVTSKLSSSLVERNGRSLVVGRMGCAVGCVQFWFGFNQGQEEGEGISSTFSFLFFLMKNRVSTFDILFTTSLYYFYFYFSLKHY